MEIDVVCCMVVLDFYTIINNNAACPPLARRSPAACTARSRSSPAPLARAARQRRSPAARAARPRSSLAQLARASRPRLAARAARGYYSRPSSAARSLDHPLLHPSLRLCHSLPCSARPGVGFCRNLVSCCLYGKAAEGFCSQMTDGKIHSCCNRRGTEVECITPAVCCPARSK